MDEPIANSSVFVLPRSDSRASLTRDGDRRVVDGDVALQDLRAGGRLDALRPDHVLERDRDACRTGVVEAPQVGVDVVVARRVGGVQLLGADVAALEHRTSPLRPSVAACRSCARSTPQGGREAPSRSVARRGARVCAGCVPEVRQRVAIMSAAPGTRRPPPAARSASATSRGSEGRGSSSASTFTRSSGCDVGGTSDRSSSDTFDTASRIASSSPPSRSSSSSVSASRASFATWKNCSNTVGALQHICNTLVAPV